MKKLTCVLIFLLIWAYPLRSTAEETLSGVIAQVIDSLDLQSLERAGEGMQTLSGANVATLLSDIATGKKTFGFEPVFDAMREQLRASLSSMLHQTVQLALPALLCALLSQLGDSLSGAELSRMARYGCFLLMLLPLTAWMLAHAQSVRVTIEDMSGRMQLLFPILLTLLSAVGGSASSAFMQPALLSASAVMTQIVTDVTLRLCICAGVVTAVNHLSGRVHLGRLAALLKQAAGWSMGVCFTVFIGVMTIQGVGTAVTDGISLRMAKYAVNNMVPVVGGMFSDTVDMLVGCSLLVKNALGVVAMLILVAVIFAPLLKLGAAQLLMRLCAALLEPVADPDVIACMDDFSGIFSLLFTTLLCVGAMFFLLVAQLLLLGNLTVMMR